MYITREDAVHRIYDVINSGIISDELASDLGDIAKCIEAEETHNVMLWGADEDATKLFIAFREDLWTDELKKEINDIYEKYKIK